MCGHNAVRLQSICGHIQSKCGRGRLRSGFNDFLQSRSNAITIFKSTCGRGRSRSSICGQFAVAVRQKLTAQTSGMHIYGNWTSNIYSILSTYNLGEQWNIENRTHSKINSLLSSLKQQIFSTYCNSWLAK